MWPSYVIGKSVLHYELAYSKGLFLLLRFRPILPPCEACLEIVFFSWLGGREEEEEEEVIMLRFFRMEILGVKVSSLLPFQYTLIFWTSKENL